METYADELRELARLLDENFYKNIPKVIECLKEIIEELKLNC